MSDEPRTHDFKVADLSLAEYGRKEIVLAAAVIAGGFGYGAVVLAFRRVLPLGRLAR